MLTRVKFPLCLLITTLLTLSIAADETNICIAALGTAPTVDGVVTGDPGWAGVVPVKMRQDGATSEATVRLGTHSGSLYIGFFVGIPAISNNNTIILGFSPQESATDPTNSWRIRLKVFQGTAPETEPDFTNRALVLGAADYWRGGGVPATSTSAATGWNDDSAITGSGATWLRAAANPNIRVAKTGTQWSLEMRIPMATATDAALDNGIFFPASTPFRMYVDVLNTLLSVPAAVKQDAWPAKQTICGTENPCIVDDELTHNTPPLSKWGLASTFNRAECADIRLDWTTIGVLDPAGGTGIIGDIRRGAFTLPTATSPCTAATGSSGLPNTFIARPTNSGAFPASVTAVFNISQFGIGPFIPIPPPGTSTDTDTVPAGGTSDLTVNWSLTPEQSCNFAPPREHQCLRVALTSPDAPIGTPVVQRNMRFVQASKAVGVATISGAQGPVRTGANKHRFLIAVDTDEQSGFARGDDHPAVLSAASKESIERFTSPELAELLPQQVNTSYGTWVARGYLYTNNTVTIDYQRFVIVDSVGDFGYIARHDAPTAKWSYSFKGPGLSRVGNRPLYTVELAPNEEVLVETTIEATEPGTSSSPSRHRFFFDIGPNSPDSGFGNFVDGRWSANVGVERLWRPNWSFEAIAGHHYFNGDAHGHEQHFCLNIEQFSINVKRYFQFGSSPLHWSVNAGGGAYYVDPPESWKWGVNVGAGVLYDINSNWGIESVYNYHGVNFSPDDLKWSTFTFGVRRSF